jgi:hypothetical protein
VRLPFGDASDSRVDGKTAWAVSLARFLRLFLAENTFELSVVVTDCNSVVDSNDDSFDLMSVALPSSTRDDGASVSVFDAVALDGLSILDDDDAAEFSFPSSPSSS